MKKKAGARKAVETLTHEEASRLNIPTAEYQSVMDKADQSPIRVAYERRNRDLDPQLVWRGKDELDWSDLVVQASPLFIQEKVHPKVLIDDLLRRTAKTEAESAASKPGFQTDLFADFNGIPEGVAKTEFYKHEQNWSNRMIRGDSLQVMASLAEREGLRGKVQCIYLDPPYGIKFNSNFQWSTTSRDVKDGKADHITGRTSPLCESSNAGSGVVLLERVKGAPCVRRGSPHEKRGAPSSQRGGATAPSGFGFGFYGTAFCGLSSA